MFDSTWQNLEADFSPWRDVHLALKGEYGARSTQDVEGDPNTAVMYVGVPIRTGQGGNGEIIGVVTVGKPMQSFGQFVSGAGKKTLYVGLVSTLSELVLVLAVSVWLVHRVLDVFGAAYDEMRDALPGRNCVDGYVQTLTHEVKSPLSAIRGAAELLQEPMPEQQRQHFLGNIQREAERIQEMVDRMMELTALENRRALSNLLDNALYFAPENSVVQLSLSRRGRSATIAGATPDTKEKHRSGAVVREGNCGSAPRTH